MATEYSDVYASYQESNNGTKRPAEDDTEDGEETAAKKARVAGSGPHVTLRLLMKSKNAGAIIGKGGQNIKRLRTDYKASIQVADCDGPERIMEMQANTGTISACLLDVIPVFEEHQKFLDSDFDCELRVLVHQSHAGLIIGRAGFKIKELREQTGANIKVFSECCPNSCERVVQVSGKPETVASAVATVLELCTTVPTKGSNAPYDPYHYDESFSKQYGGYGGFGDPPGGSPGGPPHAGRGGPGGGPPGGGGRGMRGGGGRGMGGGRGYMGGPPGYAMGYHHPPHGAGYGQMGGSHHMMGGYGAGSYGGGGGFGDQYGSQYGQSAAGGAAGGEVTTTQVTIPKDMAGSIIGKGGTRIRKIRIDSGANIKIEEAVEGSNDRIITITGTQEQIQNAQFLLQDCVRQYSR